MAWTLDNYEKKLDPKDGWMVIQRFVNGNRKRNIASFFNTEPNQTVIDDTVVNRISILNNDSAGDEEELGIQRVKNGEDSLAVVQSAVDTTPQKMARALIVNSANSRDVKDVLDIKSLYNDLSASHNPNELAAYLDIPVQAIQRIKIRIDEVLKLETELNADRGRVEEIE